MTKTKEGRETRKVQRAKTPDELNIIIARHLDILNGANVTAWDIRIAEAASNLIGKQMKVESVRISYETLRMKSGQNYKFLGAKAS
ncbi:MAG: hypothetical protein LBL64_02570 [Treponema sp.]|jgi:hypothetical protein|nr:hypothetical protein [Treponema sp.]